MKKERVAKERLRRKILEEKQSLRQRKHPQPHYFNSNYPDANGSSLRIKSNSVHRSEGSPRRSSDNRNVRSHSRGSSLRIKNQNSDIPGHMLDQVGEGL